MYVSKILFRKQTLLIVILAGTILPMAFIISSSLLRPSPSSLTTVRANTTPLDKQEKTRPGLPLRLKIPKINVDAALDYVGVTPQGALGAPDSPANAAWYDRGPRPGEQGNAVIDGHFGWKNNIPAVFDNLHKLQQGDDLYVEDVKGVTTTFVVRAVRTYGQNQDGSNVFVPSDHQAHLNLITCEGTWNQTQRSYSSRLVVFADQGVK